MSLCCTSIHAQVVENITYKGYKKTKLEVLKKLTSLQVNTKLDSIVLNNDATFLSRLPVCNKACYTVKKNTNKNYDVTYIIEETNTLIPSVNIWTANDQNVAFQIGLTEYNFLGENKEFGGFYRNNGFHSFSLNYKDPFLFNPTTGIAVSFQNLVSLEPLFFNTGWANYKYRNTSISTVFFKRLTQQHKLELGVNLFQEKYNFVEGDIPVNVPLSLKENKVLFKTGFDFNKLNYHYQYVDGFRSLLSAQYVMPIQENQDHFYILWNDLVYFKKIKTRGNFATRLRLGIASNKDTPFAPFALDNNINIRGVGNIIDRGTAMLVLNAEYRYTIYDHPKCSIQSNFFVDAGNWRSAGGKIREVFKEENLRIHPGVGLRFIHKKIYNAVFRIDYGHSILNDQQKGIVFGIGQYF